MKKYIGGYKIDQNTKPFNKISGCMWIDSEIYREPTFPSTYNVLSEDQSLGAGDLVKVLGDGTVAKASTDDRIFGVVRSITRNNIMDSITNVEVELR